MPFNFLNQGQTDNTANKVQPIDTFIDPVSKIRVSNPANLIDTDFEYGLQPTKWETVEIINNTPAFFSKSGDTTIPDITGVTTNGGTREITVTTAFPHGLDVGIPIRVAGTKSVTADGSYIINATPTPTTFTYFARANQPETISIFDLYTSIITGEFFQGSQISISDAEGMTTNGAGPASTLTIKTANKHGFGPKTPFYFLNINSTISKEFESQNSTSLSFDPTNSATAQNFDGSNTLIQTPIDLSNSATSATAADTIQSSSSTDATFSISIDQANVETWRDIEYADPLYYDVNALSGYFQSNPRGVVFIKDTSLVDPDNGTATFQVSEFPDGDPISLTSNITGLFQIADKARTFAGNNQSPESQTTLNIIYETAYEFDGSNRGYPGELESGENPPIVTSTVSGYASSNITVFTAEGTLDYYEGAMLQYTTDGSAPSALSNNGTYFVVAFSPGVSAGLYNLEIADLPGGDAIVFSDTGSGLQQFTRIGVSLDKDIIHAKNANFAEGDMLEYEFPATGRVTYDADGTQKTFFFVETAYDQHNFKLSDTLGFRALNASGGDIVTDVFANGRTYRVHAFTSTGSSTFTVNELGPSDESNALSVLVVAGGGGGGSSPTNNNDGCGGGGAGGLVFANNVIPSQTSYTISVGGGGQGINSSLTSGTDGQNSTAFGLTALGGGGGATQNTAGRSGGSGGGAGNGGGSGPYAGGAATQPTSASGGFGNPGGLISTGSNNWVGSGGGGAGAAGRSGNQGTSNQGRGGDGRYYGDVFSDSFGENGYFAGGGAGGASGGRLGGGGGNSGAAPLGGIGGGADGGYNRGKAPSGQNGTGGGGGGALGNTDAWGGDGGSGIVLVTYPVSAPADTIQASGGSVQVQDIGETKYAIHTFTSNDTFSVTSVPEDASVNSVEYLIVAGGGGGGPRGGGGGGGGVLSNVNSPIQVNSTDYSVIVGNGGQQSTNSATGGTTYNGQNSSVFGLTAIGGGAGGKFSSPGSAGGSGGGVGRDVRISEFGAASGVEGQGFPGGVGAEPASGASGCAGGAGGGGGSEQGGRGTHNRGGENTTPEERGGNGGAGFASSITGVQTIYAGGGGGGVGCAGNNSVNYGLGGGSSSAGQKGGGADGAVPSRRTVIAALPNTGGGGGGGGDNNGFGGGQYTGGPGGSGIVIIRYPIGPADV